MKVAGSGPYRPVRLRDFSMSERRYFILLLVVIVPLFWLGNANRGLWGTDEPRVAEIGREMALTGNWAVPTLNQKPFLEQPPLYYASLAATFRIFGVSDRVARIPSALFGMGGAIALFFLGSMLFGPRVGLLSAFVMATSFEYFQIAHRVLVDSALTCFVVTAMAFFVAGYSSVEKKKKLLYYILLYVSCTLAFYSKGFVGIVIPGLGVLTFLAFERNLKELLRMRLWLGILIFIVMVLPWFLALWNQGGSEHLRVVVVDNHLNRFIRPGVLGHAKPFYFYLIDFPPGFVPWILLIVPVLYRAFTKVSELPPASRKGLLFAKCWFFGGFIFLSIASGKRLLYTLPIFAPLSLLTAFYVDSILGCRTMRAVEKFFVWMLGLFPLAIGVAAVPLYYRFMEGDVSEASRGVPAAVLVFSPLAVGLSLISLWFLFRRDVKRFWIAHGTTIFALLVFLLVALVPTVDRHRSITPFCEQVKAVVGSDKPLYAYKADESLRGAIPFYTGRYIEEIDSLEQLQEILKKGDQVFIVERDKGGRLEKQLLSTGKLSVLIRHNMGNDRSLLLLTNNVSPGSTESF
jgi:4-amino-4-deoxy-L-arabinose transferase-like glycosyltransferase